MYFRRYRYDPVAAGSHARDAYDRLQRGRQIGAASALFVSADNGPNYAVGIYLYGRP